MNVGPQRRYNTPLVETALATVRFECEGADKVFNIGLTTGFTCITMELDGGMLDGVEVVEYVTGLGGQGRSSASCVELDAAEGGVRCGKYL